jgi:hypothetical protein
VGQLVDLEAADAVFGRDGAETRHRLEHQGVDGFFVVAQESLASTPSGACTL